MNLIEQLGGYEKAKEKMDDICHTLDNSELLGGGDAREGLYERLESIDKALLEYRRQHNIFEQGDPVVSRCADREIRIFTYQETIGKNILVKCKKGKGYCYPKKWFSHANDAEIKAGKRLEVKSEN